MSWDGEERRDKDRDDHDLLTKIDTNLSNFMSRFKEHTEKDEKSFDTLENDVGSLKRYVYICMGGLIVLEFVMKFVK